MYCIAYRSHFHKLKRLHCPHIHALPTWCCMDIVLLLSFFLSFLSSFHLIYFIFAEGLLSSLYALPHGFLSEKKVNGNWVENEYTLKSEWKKSPCIKGFFLILHMKFMFLWPYGLSVARKLCCVSSKLSHCYKLGANTLQLPWMYEPSTPSILYLSWELWKIATLK